MPVFKPTFGPIPGQESHKLDILIDCDEDGWFTKLTCPLCPEYIQVLREGKRPVVKTVDGIHHWFTGSYTKHLERN